MRMLFDGTVELACISSSKTHTVAMGKTILKMKFPTWVGACCLFSLRACCRHERGRIGVLDDAHVLYPLHLSVANLRHGQSNTVVGRGEIWTRV